MRQDLKEKAYNDCGWSIVGFLVYVILVWAMVGCKSIEYVPVIEHRTDTVIKTHQRLDSIYVHDSTYIHERGDTVWVERWHTRWRDRLLLDTIYEAVHDTVPALPAGTGTWQTSTPGTCPPGSERSLTWWQQTRIYIGNIAIFATIILLIIFILKRKFKL